MNIANKVGDIIEIDWKNNLFDLQPDNVKLPVNIEALKQSLIKHGFVLPFAVWNNKGKCFCIDGHTRKSILIELEKEGVQVPKKLKAFEIKAKSKNEAIQILVEVYNQKQNPFDDIILMEWLDLEEIDIEEIDLDSVNVMTNDHQYEDFQGSDGNYEENSDDSEYSEPDNPSSMIAITLTQDETELWIKVKEHLKIRQDKKAVLELLNKYGNETGII